MHIAWTRHLLDNREFIVGGGTQPNTEPSRGEGLDGSAAQQQRKSVATTTGTGARKSVTTTTLPHHTRF